MPKRLNMLLVIGCALLLGVLPLRAQPSVDELLRFADDAPFNAIMFGAIRTDSAYIETLDGVIAQITSALPSDLVPPGLTVSELLDLASSQLTGASFNQGLRPILGDVAAFAVGDLGAQIDNIWYNDSEVPLALYLAIRDRNAVNEAVNELLLQATSSVSVTDTPAGTLYAADLRPITYFLVRSDSLVIATSPSMLPNGGASLSDSPYFQSAVGSLPAEGGYNIIGYVDVAYFGSAIVGSDRWLSGDDRVLRMLIARSLGVVAGGATILDGRTLTGDVVLSPGNLQPLESFGVDVRGAPEPLNGALLGRVPDDSALVWHGTYPLGALDLVDRSVSGAVEGLFGGVLDADPVSRAAFDALGASLMFYPNALLTNLGGLGFEDYAEWLQGDYLVVLRPNFSYAPFPGPGGMPFDGGIILEAASPEGSRERMLRFARELTLMLRAGSLPRNTNIIPVQTRIGDADAVLLRASVENFTTRSVSYLDFAIAADDQVMVIGSLDFVETVLGNANAETSPFDADQGVLLPESRLALYVNPRALSAMALPIFGYNWDFDRPRIQLPLLALTLFDGSTASLTFDEAGNTVMRFTLTLAQDQAANAAAATATYEAFAATATASWEQFTPPSTPTPFPTFTPFPSATPFATPTPAALTQAIRIGETITGNLAAGARDAYTLVVPSSAAITIDMEAGFDTFLELRDASDAVIMINDDRGDGTLNSRITADLSAGTYTIIARAFSTAASGSYTLSVSTGSAAAATPTLTATPIGGASTAGTIAVGETVTGNLAAGARDAYRITVAAGGTFTIDMEAGFDTFLELRDASDAVVASNDDRGDGTLNSRIVVDNPAAGTYTIIARAFASSGSGAYTLRVSAGAVVPPTATIIPTAAPSAAGTIAVGETVTGSLVAGARDAYTLTLPAGANVVIDLDSTAFDTYLELQLGGVTILQNDDRGDGTFNSRIEVTNAAGGTFTIIVRGFSNSGAGAYTLTVRGAAIQPTAAAVTADAIILDTEIRGEIARGGNATYTLTVDAPVNFTFILSSPDFDTVIEVFDATNNRVGYNDDYPGLGTDSRIDTLALAAGTYRVVARSFGDAGGGAFFLFVTEAPGGGSGMNTSVLPFAMTATAIIQQATDIAATFAVPATPAATAAPMTITVGQTVTATLARGQRNPHTFTAAAGDIITIDMEASFDTYVRLLDASGRMIAENDDRGDGTYNSRIRSFSIPAAGTYTITAGSFGDASGGEYTLTLSRG
jgi:hypothetical protein